MGQIRSANRGHSAWFPAEVGGSVPWRYPQAIPSTAAGRLVNDLASVASMKVRQIRFAGLPGNFPGRTTGDTPPRWPPAIPG